MRALIQLHLGLEINGLISGNTVNFADIGALFSCWGIYAETSKRMQALSQTVATGD